ncbi:MAG: ATP-binding protein [Verrucomicrobiales bacterium]|nr:ATP-binding protein [Verrucomicrobiales bacterium]
MKSETTDRDTAKTNAQLPEEIRGLRKSLAARENHCRTVVNEDERRSAFIDIDEERFFHAMQGAANGLWDWNLETNDVYYSPRWKSMLGYADDELPNHLNTWSSLVHPDDHDRALKVVSDYVEGRIDLFEIEMRMIHKDGHEIVVLSRGHLCDRNFKSKPTRLIGSHLDITARIKSEQFIVATSEILEMIATREPAIDIYEAVAHLYESRHPGLRCSMLELENNTLIHAGAPSLPAEYCDTLDGVEIGPEIGSCGTATYFGKRVLVEDIETDPKWQAFKHVALPHGMRACWSEPVKSSTGEVLGTFAMYSDVPALPTEAQSKDLASAARLAGIIMEREKSERELNRYKDHLEELVAQRTHELEETKQEAEEASLAKSKFLSNMSHELRTPLNAIIGFGQLLVSDSESPVNEGHREGLDQILKSGNHLLNLITEVLNLSQIEAGKLPLSIKPTPLSPAIREAVAIVKSMALENEITVTFEAPADSETDISVLADPVRLKQILLNLLSNSIKYNQRGGEVNIRIHSFDSQHHIEVTDTGTGIEEKNLATLFEPFNRLGASAGNIEGTGIGLTITKRLTEVMHGSISVESIRGEGSAFTVSLPAGKHQTSKAAKENSRLTPGSDRQARDRNVTILYVEDNSVNIKLVRKILHRRPLVRLLVAENGTDGIQVATDCLPDLILMDMHLPDMTGIETVRTLRKQDSTKAIPVVGVSADAMPDTVKQSELEGFADYITKPFEIDHLLEVVDSFIAEKSRDPGLSNPARTGAVDPVELPS